MKGSHLSTLNVRGTLFLHIHTWIEIYINFIQVRNFTRGMLFTKYYLRSLQVLQALLPYSKAIF
jgi:hypothetical protein